MYQLYKTINFIGSAVLKTKTKRLNEGVLKIVERLEHNNSELAKVLYDNAINIDEDERNNGYCDNRFLQLMTVSADLDNNDAINWLHTHKAFIINRLAENLDKQSYKLFLERENMQKNRYSLYMLGMINQTNNSPDFWGKPVNNTNFQRKKALDYYNAACNKNNPMAMIELAYMLQDDDYSDYDSDSECHSDLRITCMNNLLNQAEKLGL